MHFLPILSTLRRHRTAAALIILEIALTCGIVCNTIFLIGERLARMDRPSGVAETELLHVDLTNIGKDTDEYGQLAQDVAALKAIPGVKSAAGTNQIPYGGSSWNSSVSTTPDDHESNVNATMYMGTEDLLETLGVRLIAGRDFTPDEYLTIEDVKKKKVPIASIIISKGLAEKMFPGQNALGKQLYVWNDKPQTVVGIVERLARPVEWFAEGVPWAVVYPVRVYTGTYVLRTDPGRRAEVLKAAVATLEKNDRSRIVLAQQTFEEVRAAYYRQDRAMAWLLVGVCIALLLITALGIVGLASFWVQQRTRQIGIRRALGASRGDILRYFQTENFILATIGIVLGMGFAYGINLLLMDKYQVPRLPAMFLPIGAVLVWLLGQVAVLGPARRAAMIPPAVATRTV